MIEAPNNLACLQHGANPKYIQLHAQTQCKLHYNLKHKYGISQEFNHHQATQPWYSMGQGAGDTCNRWVIGPDSLANAYQEHAHGWTISSPTPPEQLTQSWKAFIDDVNLFIGKPKTASEDKFLNMAQTDINWWHGLLQATRGKLHIKKCFWSNFQLKFDQNRTPSIQTKTQDNPQIHLTHWDGSTEVLKTTKPDKGI